MTKRAVVIGTVLLAALVGVTACGSGGGEHALHARRVPHSAPPTSAEVTTTTTTPPDTAPPVTVIAAPTTTAAPQPAVDCLTVLNQFNAASQQTLGRNASKAELVQLATGIGRTDCAAAVDSYRPPYNPPLLPPLPSLTVPGPSSGPNCDIAHYVC
jgi:hypothetical protein